MISRTVGAGAGPQRGPGGGDRARPRRRAIRRSGTSARACWTPAGASASGSGSATTSTRCGWSTCWRTSTSPSRCATGSCTTPAARASRRRSRARSSGSWTGSPTSTTTSTTRCGPACSALGDLPAEEIAVLGETGSRRIDTLVHDLVEHSERAGDIVQGDVVGPAMLRLRTFMFEHVYLAPAARAEHAKIERVLRGLFEWYVRASRGAPRGRPRRLGGRPRDRLPGRDDRPLRDPRLDRALRAAGLRGMTAPTPRAPDGALHPGVPREGPRRDRLRGARGRAHGAQALGHQPAAGAVPVPRGADAVVRDRPRGEALPLLRLRGGRRRLLVRDGDGGAGLRRRAGVARRAGGGRARARERGSARRGEAGAARPAAGAAGAHGRLLRARAVGEPARRRGRASTCSAAGSTRRRCASSGSATRRRAGTAC